MRRRRRRKSLVPAFLSRVVAGVLLTGLAIVEALHDLQPVAWPGFDLRANWIGLLLVPLFVVGAVAAFAPRRSAWWLTAGAATIAVTHGLILRLGDSGLAYGYVGSGLLTLAALGLSLWLSTPEALRRPRAHAHPHTPGHGTPALA